MDKLLVVEPDRLDQRHMNMNDDFNISTIDVMDTATFRTGCFTEKLGLFIDPVRMTGVLVMDCK